jgi:hypothetical protein
VLCNNQNRSSRQAVINLLGHTSLMSIRSTLQLCLLNVIYAICSCKLILLQWTGKTRFGDFSKLNRLRERSKKHRTLGI